MSFLSSLPKASLIDVFKAYPELTKPIHEFAQTLMRGDSPFTEGERELIAAFVSYSNQCNYCRSSHTAVAEKFGQSKELMKEFPDDLISNKMKPILNYVKKLNAAPSQVEKADVDAILATGWDEKAVVDAALVCGFFNFMNRWVEGLGIEADSKIASMAAEHLYQHGYQSIEHLYQYGYQSILKAKQNSDNCQKKTQKPNYQLQPEGFSNEKNYNSHPQ